MNVSNVTKKLISVSNDTKEIICQEKVKNFKYLVSIFTEEDDDTTTIVGQIKKSRQQLNHIARTVKRKGANPITMGKFYFSVLQSVLLYGIDSWTLENKTG